MKRITIADIELVVEDYPSSRPDFPDKLRTLNIRSEDGEWFVFGYSLNPNMPQRVRDNISDKLGKHKKLEVGDAVFVDYDDNGEFIARTSKRRK